MSKVKKLSKYHKICFQITFTRFISTVHYLSYDITVIQWLTIIIKSYDNILRNPWLLSMYRNDPEFSDRYVWANSADPDQTAPRGAV